MLVLRETTLEAVSDFVFGCVFLIRNLRYLIVLLFVFLFVSVKYEELYCFSFNPKLDKEEREKGWKLVDLNDEYNRMGIPNSYWQISDVNRDYGVSYFFNVMGPLEWISSLAVSFLVLRCKTLVYSVLYTCVVWYSSSPFPTLKCIQIAGKRMHLHLMCNLSTVSFKC